jgi:hypothetical protein
VKGCCDHGEEPSGSIKCWEILESLRSWKLLKKDLSPWNSLDRICENRQHVPFRWILCEWLAFATSRWQCNVARIWPIQGDYSENCESVYLGRREINWAHLYIKTSGLL